MIINKHLIKTSPLYTYNGEVVKVVHGYKTDKGLELVVEYLSGVNKGKITQVKKDNLWILKQSN